MSTDEKKYCLVCGMPDPDDHWCKYCRNSYKRARRDAERLPLQAKIIISPESVEYIYKKGLKYIWVANWYNSNDTLIYLSKIETLMENHPESIRDLKEYKITKYYKHPLQ